MIAMAGRDLVSVEQRDRERPGCGVGRAFRPASAQPAGLTVRIATSPRDRRAAFRLAYDKYVEQGMLRPNRYRLRVTEYHLLESTAVFIAERYGQIVGTASLIGDGQLGLPLDSVHPEIVESARRCGFRVGEASSLAIRGSGRLPDLPVFIGLTRLMVQYARHHKIHQFLVACVPSHARFYRRFLGFELIGGVRPFPMVCNTLGVTCRVDFAEIDRCRPDCYDTYFSQRMRPENLVHVPMTELERALYGRVIEHADHRIRASA